MSVETGDFHDWEVLHSSDSDSVDDMKDLEGIESESGGVIRPDYFSLDSQRKYLMAIGDVVEEDSVESDNPSWIEPGSDTRSPRKVLGGFWSDSGSDRSDDRKLGEFEGREELGRVENGKGEVGSDGIETEKAQVGSDGIAVEGENSGKFWSDSSGYDEKSEMSGGVDSNARVELELSSAKKEGAVKQSDNGDVVTGAINSGGEGEEGEKGEKRIMVWWKLPLELLKYCAIRISPVWTVSMAAAVLGFVILGQRYYRMKKKSTSVQLKVTMDDKMISQFKSRVAKLNEAFSIVRRVPVIRPTLPVAGVTPWPVMTMR